MLTSNSNHSHQIQITHSKFKSLTANSNCSQQIKNPPQQITNRSHQIQIVHIKYKLLTEQMQIVHIKYKSLTANTNTVSVKGGLRMRTADQGKKQTEGKMKTAD